MAEQAATIKDLILATAKGAAAGVELLESEDIPVEPVAKTSYKRTTTYGLKVRFLFTGRSEESTAVSGTA